MEMLVCNQCKARKFANGFSEHKTRSTGRQGICRDCERGNAAERRARRGKVIECPGCGVLFKSSGRATCSRPCQYALRNAVMDERGVQPGYTAADGLSVAERGGRSDGRKDRGRTAKPASRRGRAEDKLRRAAEGSRNYSTRIAVGPCRSCGRQFARVRPWAKSSQAVNGQQHTCGDPKCRRDVLRATRVRGSSKRRAAEAGVEWDCGIDTIEVAESAGWVCGICNLPIDGGLEWPHPRSLTLDHIVPVSRGGGHVRRNVQPAHFVCNSSKRDGRPVSSQ